MAGEERQMSGVVSRKDFLRLGGVLAEAGLLRSLGGAYRQNGWDIYNWARRRVTYDGTLYGVPDRLQERPGQHAVLFW